MSLLWDICWGYARCSTAGGFSTIGVNVKKTELNGISVGGHVVVVVVVPWGDAGGLVVKLTLR